MGNTFSQRNAVTVVTEKQVYYDGEEVEGVVCLNLVDPLGVSSIEIQLQGLERTDFVTETFGTNRTDLGRLDQFLSLCSTLPGTADLQLAPGQYQWCFVLALPKGARSTFRAEERPYRQADFMCAKVEYGINVYIAKRDKSGRQVPALPPHSHPLVVHRRATATAVTSIERSLDETLTRWCCIHEGSIGVHVVVDRCMYLPGDEVRVKVEVDNQSPRRVEAVQLALHHLISLRMTEQLDERRFIEHFYRVPVGMPVEPFSKQDRLMSITLPEQLPHTHEGTCFDSKYWVATNLRMEVGTGDVGIKVPVTVLPPQPHDHGLQLPDLPDWWRPQLMGGQIPDKVAGGPGLQERFAWLALGIGDVALKVVSGVLSA